jgi:hypothetical protein
MVKWRLVAHVVRGVRGEHPSARPARAGGHLAKALALVGGERGDEDEPDDVADPVAALEITAPP